MKNNFNKAFTLVELIVVITILAVLATVAFISFQWYTSSSRDSVRLADLKNISKSFEINRTKGIDFPLPDKKVDISSSGTVFQYQGELSQEILNSDLNIFDWWVDPLTWENYWYAVNSARNKFQIIWFLENSQNLTNISLGKTFADNNDKYVKSSGDNLGILLDEINHELITDENEVLEIDVADEWNLVNRVMTYSDQIVTQKDIISGIQFNSYLENESSCGEILEKNPQLSGQDGYYFLHLWNQVESVYCDMTTDGGWWTLYTWKWDFYFKDTSYLEVFPKIIDNIDFSQIRYIYTTPQQNTFHLIHTPYSYQEWHSILMTPDRISADKWNNIWHYTNTNDFANAFRIWENNTTTITQEDFRNRIISSNLVRMNAWVDGNGSFTHSMWTAFSYGTDLIEIFWFPSRPYIWTWTMWDEDFSHKDYVDPRDDGRSITIWIK